MKRIVALWRSRRFRLVGLAVLSAAAFVVAGAWVMRLEEEWRFASVELGMTEDEVLEAMGKPPGDYGPAGARYGRSMWMG
jgi:hypothetical protein